MATPSTPKFVDYMNDATTSSQNAMGWSVALAVVSSTSVFVFAGMPFLNGAYGGVGGEWCTSATTCDFTSSNNLIYEFGSGTACTGPHGYCSYMGLSLATAQGYPVVAIGGGYYSSNDPLNIALLSCTDGSSGNGPSCSPTATAFNPPLSTSCMIFIFTCAKLNKPSISKCIIGTHTDCAFRGAVPNKQQPGGRVPVHVQLGHSIVHNIILHNVGDPFVGRCGNVWFFSIFEQRGHHLGRIRAWRPDHGRLYGAIFFFFSVH